MIQGPKLKHLYQEVILDHNRSPRNYKELQEPTHYSHGVNSLCGDDYHLHLRLTPEGNIEDIGFQGHGCAISKASASIMTTLVKGKSWADACELAKHFVALMTQDSKADAGHDWLGRMIMFEGVREFPVRVKCATLIWHALEDALKDAAEGEADTVKSKKE